MNCDSREPSRLGLGLLTKMPDQTGMISAKKKNIISTVTIKEDTPVHQIHVTQLGHKPAANPLVELMLVVVIDTAVAQHTVQSYSINGIGLVKKYAIPFTTGRPSLGRFTYFATYHSCVLE